MKKKGNDKDWCIIEYQSILPIYFVLNEELRKKVMDVMYENLDLYYIVSSKTQHTKNRMLYVNENGTLGHAILGEFMAFWKLMRNPKNPLFTVEYQDNNIKHKSLTGKNVYLNNEELLDVLVYDEVFSSTFRILKNGDLIIEKVDEKNTDFSIEENIKSLDMYFWKLLPVNKFLSIDGFD